MKKKDIKSIAKRIAEQELILQKTTDPEKVKRAQNEIMDLTSKAKNIEDLMAIDVAVQEILEGK